jgi:hypothetical protein
MLKDVLWSAILQHFTLSAIRARHQFSSKPLVSALSRPPQHTRLGAGTLAVSDV